MQLTIRTLLRLILVSVAFPRAGLASATRLLRLLPGCASQTVYREDRVETKTVMREQGQCVGHALGDRHVELSWRGRRLLSVRLKEGPDATADQFFLNRPVKDLDHLLKLAAPHVTPNPGDIVFDPGCGAGRHLLALSDRFGVQGVGIDVYAPAINVAGAANRFGGCRFHCRSSLEPGLMASLLPGGCEVVFINSWLNHVRAFDGFSEFLQDALGKCDYLLVINTVKDPLDFYFNETDMLAHKVHGRTQYALVQGKRHEKNNQNGLGG